MYEQQFKKFIPKSEDLIEEALLGLHHPREKSS